MKTTLAKTHIMMKKKNLFFDRYFYKIKEAGLVYLYLFFVSLLFGSCIPFSSFHEDNKIIIELGKSAEKECIYEDFQSFKLNMNGGKYHSIEQLPSNIFPNGIKFCIGDKGIYCICTDVLNREGERGKGVDYYLLSELFNEKPIKSVLDLLQERRTVLSLSMESYLKHNTEIDLRQHLFGSKPVMFDSPNSKGFVCVRNDECDIYCFSKINDCWIQLTLLAKNNISTHCSLCYEALNLIENISFQ